jgi:hypothetical protein
MTTNGQTADIAALTNGYLIRLQRLTRLIQREVEHLAELVQTATKLQDKVAELS